MLTKLAEGNLTDNEEAQHKVHIEMKEDAREERKKESQMSCSVF